MKQKKKNFLSKMAKIKNDVKDDISSKSPFIGKVVDNADKLIRTVQNGHRSIPFPVKQLIKVAAPQIPTGFPSIPKFNKKVADLYNIPEGTHIMVKRFGYEHHGLSTGYGMVMHYSEGRVKTNTITEFCGKSIAYIVNSPCIYDPDHVVSRAYSRYAETEYNLLVNNCEHFVLWCRSGSEIHHHI